jgi:hypothetical protein
MEALNEDDWLPVDHPPALLPALTPESNKKYLIINLIF